MSRPDCVDSRSAEETRRLGSSLGRALQAGDVVALSGDLGAGKTCLVQGIARGLDVPPEVPVTSPTFTLVGEYPGRLPLRHADFYRVESYARLAGAGFDDLLDGKGVLVVEWPELFPDALPQDRLEVHIALLAQEGPEAGGAGASSVEGQDPPRRLSVLGSGERGRALAEEVLRSWR
ncbi:MAG: tRNA (adenosine(37)-N6)-threonylcarbamoyltransferase complex ATPase subunit type 1 TsaE [Deltaproteobacteria bacterium]|nr:tRNA (adenosine(37)-N6)-threonylcarbamoyltransferase complex ATPase subunit type 1 TsaE [Deltaproteobacteria bacterium]MBW2413831.1 tRNA (adenosine(37)-N6)-threonylcarbamoyltransferase complex ATPase subunit type 1 TsaE [Deltaproteobacteria bacterium]